MTHASWPRPLTFWPQSKWVSRTHRGPCLRQVILAAAIFEISCEKPTDKHTYRQTNTKTPLYFSHLRPTQPFILSKSINWVVSNFIGCVPVAWLTRTDTCDHSSVTSSISVDMKTRAFAINFSSKCLTGDFPLRPSRTWAVLANESTRLPGDTPSIWRFSAPYAYRFFMRLQRPLL